MTIPTLTTLPVAPARTDPPATFVTRADAFLAAIVTFQGEMNTSIGAMNTDIAGVNADAISAAASATAAANASNASAWVSGTTYALGDVVYSPIDYQSYRRIIAGAGATDPSSDATNWTKISAEPLPSQTGNAGSYLTTDGTDASWAEVSASPTLEATASGALANGDMVIVNADGTVSVVTQTIDPTPVVGSSAIFESANSDTISSTFDSTSNKVIICYRDAGNSDYGTAVVGEISGNSISFGTPVIFQSVDSRDSSITYDPNANKVLIVYGRNSGFISGNAIVGTVSGNSITFGSTAEFEAASVEDTSCTFDSTANKVVIGCRQATGSYSFIISATISGTSVSFGSPEGWENGSKIRVNYDANSNKTIITYRDSSNRPRAIVATLSGTAFSLGSIVPLSINSVTYPISTIDTNVNKVVAAWVYSNTIYAAVGTVSGTTISFGSASTYSSGAVNYMNMTFDTSTNKLVIVYRDDSNLSRGTAIIGTVSGTTVSFANKTVFNAATTNYSFVTFDSNSGKNLISYQNNGNSNYGTSTVFSSATITTNLTEGNFIGVSDSAYSDGATAKIQLVGSVDDAQSGLTAGQSYYVQGDGTLATSPDSPSVFAGTSVSATNLIVKG